MPAANYLPRDTLQGSVPGGMRVPDGSRIGKSVDLRISDRLVSCLKVHSGTVGTVGRDHHRIIVAIFSLFLSPKNRSH